jgi:hypothetical protein
MFSNRFAQKWKAGCLPGLRGNLFARLISSRLGPGGYVSPSNRAKDLATQSHMVFRLMRNCARGYTDCFLGFRTWFENTAQDLLILGIICMCAVWRDKERSNFEARISHVNIDDIDAFDIWNVPGKQVVRVAPCNDLRLGNGGGMVLQESLPLVYPVSD